MNLRLQLFLSFAAIIVIMIIIMITTHRSLNSLIDKEGWVKHTHEVITLANLVQKLLIDMETGQRGFVITGKANFLDPYYKGDEQYRDTMASLQKLVADNRQQGELLKVIDKLVQQWQDEAAIPEINSRNLVNEGKEPFATVEKMISSEKGKSIMDLLRTKIHTFIDNEEILLSQRRQESVDAAVNAKSVIISGTLIAIFIGVISVLFIIQNIRGKVGGDPSEIDEMVSLIAGGKLVVSDEKDDSNTSGILASVIKMANELHQVTEEKDSLRTQFDGVLHELRELRSALPVCSLCKNVSREQKVWDKLERYAAHRSGIGAKQWICPDCKSNKTS